MGSMPSVFKFWGWRSQSGRVGKWKWRSWSRWNWRRRGRTFRRSWQCRPHDVDHGDGCEAWIQ
mgnify:CR=1 FL=1